MKAISRNLILIGALGCLHTHVSEVERVREGLIGLTARDLRSCLPVPQVDPDGEWEHLTYNWFPEQKPYGFEPDVAAVPGRAGPEHDWPLPAGRREGERVAYCRLVISLHAGVVREVRAKGRDHLGLNTNDDCLLQTRRCLPQGP